MYTRSPTPGGTRGMRIPRNYSGNAFAAPQTSPQEEPIPTEEEAPVRSVSADLPEGESAPPEKQPKETPIAKLFPSLGLRPGKLLGSFGTEELLILGLIFLLRGNEGSDDLLLLLVLLLLIQ